MRIICRDFHLQPVLLDNWFILFLKKKILINKFGSSDALQISERENTE
ncbi:hypothetical protein COXBURSA334_1036 [Coxiella burnetii Q321]|nr:hypothetical protein COXBURSA334_1036 [Coxiella burnetii Q321]